MKIERTEEFMNLKTENIENHQSQFTPVKQILEPGVNVIASLDAAYRIIFQEQLAVSITKGDPFLDCFETQQSDVLILKKGKADTAISKQRIYRTDNNPGEIEVVESDKRIEPDDEIDLPENSGLINFVVPYINKGKKVLFLGDIDDIQTNLSCYIKHETESSKDKFDALDPRFESFIYERGRRNIRKLRDICAEYDVSIIIGHDLTLKGKLKHSPGIYYCDGKLLLSNGSDDWKLKIEGANSVGKQSFNLNYNGILNFYLSDEEFRNMTDLGLTDLDMGVIDAMWGKGPMRVTDIENESGISHSTVIQRLKYLQKKQKGSWVAQLNKTYQVDESKERAWLR